MLEDRTVNGSLMRMFGAIVLPLLQILFRTFLLIFLLYFYFLTLIPHKNSREPVKRNCSSNLRDLCEQNNVVVNFGQKCNFKSIVPALPVSKRLSLSFQSQCLYKYFIVFFCDDSIFALQHKVTLLFSLYPQQGS